MSRGAHQGRWRLPRQIGEPGAIPGPTDTAAFRSIARDLGPDVREALRTLRRAPAVASASALLLTLAIAASVAVFTMVDAVLVRSLPFSEPDRLACIWSTRTDRARAFFSIPDFEDVRERNRTLEDWVGFAPWGANLMGEGGAERLQGVRISGHAFRTLGVTASRGRTLEAADDAAGATPVLVLTHGFWLRRFGGDERAIGRRVSLDAQPYVVVGVLPEEFVFPAVGVEADFLVPLAPQRDPRREDRGTHFLRAFGRLRAGATVAATQADLARVVAQLRSEHPDTDAKNTAPRVIALHEELASDYHATLVSLLLAVVLLLLVTCCNLAGLGLVRASARRRELAIRNSLGASRGRLVRLLATEGILVAAAGGVFGLAIGVLGTPWLAGLGPPEFARAWRFSLDGRVLAFASVEALLAALVLGLGPAVLSSRLDAQGELHAGRGTTPHRVSSRARFWLVVGELAASLALVVGAGLVLRSVVSLGRVSPGFDAKNLLVVRLSLPGSRYGSAAAVVRFLEEVERRLTALPGVEGVAGASVLPLSGLNVRTDYRIVGRAPSTPADVPAAQQRLVTPGYFRTLGIPLLEGREFTVRDAPAAPAVAAVDEALARQQWPGGGALGAHLRLEDAGPTPREVEVVAVVGGVKHDKLDDGEAPTLYLPLAQVPLPAVPFLINRLHVALRTASEPAALGGAVQEQIQDLDRDVPASNHRPMEEFLEASLRPRRFVLRLLAAFALASLALAVIGLYGVVSYSVSLARNEFAVRLALGARPRDVLALVLRRGLKLVLVGEGLGLVLALAGTRLLEGQVFGVPPRDPLTLGASALVLGLATGLACLPPARAAARTDPAASLRG